MKGGVIMKNRLLFYVLFSLILFVIFWITFSTNIFSAYPKLVSKLISGFESIKGWIIKIATPAAAVAVRNRNIYEKI